MQSPHAPPRPRPAAKPTPPCGDGPAVGGADDGFDDRAPTADGSRSRDAASDGGGGEAGADLLAQYGLPGQGDVVGGKYRIECAIGSGGMGVVVRALHQELGERVAVKFLNPSLGADPVALERFEREARAVFRLQSEHVVRVMDVGRLDGGTPFLVMELLEGQDLAQLLASEREPSIEEAIRIVLEAAEALAEAHAHGVVHRDLKPENIFLALKPDGSTRVKVLDFGLSKIAPPPWMMPRRARPITAMHQPVGTPNYMAPELWTSAHDAGPACDQWALGALLYELVAGAPAYAGDNVVKLCNRMINEPVPLLSRWRDDVPRALERAVARAMEKSPSERFPSLLELAEAIAPFGPPRAGRSVERIRRCRALETTPATGSQPAESPPSPAPDGPPGPPDGQAPAARTPADDARRTTVRDDGPLPQPDAAADTQALPSPVPEPSPAPLAEALPPMAPAPPSSGPEPPTARNWQRMLDDAPKRANRRWICLGLVALALVGALLAVTAL